jgi:hypothetical protein
MVSTGTTITEVSTPSPKWMRVIAKVISYIFHPLFIPTYIFVWMYERFPFEFSGITPNALFFRLVGVFWTTAFFPAFAVFLLWRLKLIKSIFLKTQQERIIPYVISMFFYWWMYYLSRNFPDQPIALKFFYFGIFICTVFALIANNFFKISMHGIGVGGALMCMVLTCFHYHTYLGADLMIIFLLTGMVCTSRLIVSDHKIPEIYIGLIAGIVCQLLAYIITI